MNLLQARWELLFVLFTMWNHGTSCNWTCQINNDFQTTVRISVSPRGNPGIQLNSWQAQMLNIDLKSLTRKQLSILPISISECSCSSTKGIAFQEVDVQSTDHSSKRSQAESSTPQSITTLFCLINGKQHIYKNSRNKGNFTHMTGYSKDTILFVTKKSLWPWLTAFTYQAKLWSLLYQVQSRSL